MLVSSLLPVLFLLGTVALVPDPPVVREERCVYCGRQQSGRTPEEAIASERVEEQER